MASSELIDTHQHLWVMSERAYDWIVPGYGPLYDDFGPERLEPEIPASGVTASVLVQAADTYEDTFYMLDVAHHSNFVKAVVAWIPFDRTNEARAALELLKKDSLVKGVRNLTHNYADKKYESDDKWILRQVVQETIALVEASGLSMDYVAVNAAHIENVAILAQNFPKLKIVIDHLAKPPIASKGWEPWALLMAEASSQPNVYAKISGLNTASNADWSVADWQPYVDFIVEKFGSHRTMLGGDWPVIVLMNNYADVWKAQVEVISRFSAEDQEWIRSKTAKQFYNLGN
jgi:L-fuconolactonase